MGVTRAHFGSTVTVTIQLVGDAASNRADAVPDTGGNSYTVTILRANDTNQRTDGAADAVTDGTASSKETKVLKVDASGKATFEITAPDPDATDRNNPDGRDASTGPPPVTAVADKIDRTRVTFTVVMTSGGREVDNAISSTDGSPSAQTITFSDARAVPVGASVMPATDYLMTPTSGSASNVVTVTVVDQYGKPVRGHLVRLTSEHVPPGADATGDLRVSTFPVARRTDSSGSVRIGYTFKGGASVESIQANTVTDPTATFDPTITADDIGTAKAFYWAAAAGATAEGAVLAADLERKTIIVAGADGPQLVLYDDNDQFVVGADNLTSMAAFEEALTADGQRVAGRNDTVVVSSYDSTDPTDVARFVLTVVDN